METSYFAAQTMQNKVRYSFDELPDSVHCVSYSSEIVVLHATPPPKRERPLSLREYGMRD